MQFTICEWFRMDTFSIGRFMIFGHVRKCVSLFISRDWSGQLLIFLLNDTMHIPMQLSHDGKGTGSHGSTCVPLFHISELT